MISMRLFPLLLQVAVCVSVCVCVWVGVGVCVLVSQSWLTLCHPVDFSPLGSSVH